MTSGTPGTRKQWLCRCTGAFRTRAACPPLPRVRPSSGSPTADALLADSLVIFDDPPQAGARERVITIGFSIGAGVAAYLAAHRPAWVGSSHAGRRINARTSLPNERMRITTGVRSTCTGATPSATNGTATATPCDTLLSRRMKNGKPMMPLFLALILFGAITTTARAQDILDLKGTWLGKGKSIVFGSNAHHGGSQTPNDPPRVREIEVTHVVEGQEGNVAWGRSSSAAADTKEPFAWALSNDNRSILGADTDGYFRITLLSPDRMEKCYTHNATGPSRSVVATCYLMERVRR